MFAIAFASFVKTRIEGAKEIKQERKSNNQTTAKKSLVPDIAKRGIVALAIVVLGVSSAQAGKFGGGGASGAGFARKPSSLGSGNVTQLDSLRTQRQTTPIQPVQPIKQVEPVKSYQPVKDVEPIKQVQASDAICHDCDHKLEGHDGGAGISRHVDSLKHVDPVNKSDLIKRIDTIKKPDSGKLVDAHKPAELNHKIDAAKPLDLHKNLGPKNGNLDARLNKHPGKLADAVKPLGTNNKKVNGKLVDAIKAGRLDSLTNGPAARKLGMGDQFKLMDKGDIARRLKLSDKLAHNGGWSKRMCGPIDSHYCDHCKGRFYCGPKWCPHHCWCPMWCDWVEWCFGGAMWFDPRPDFCEPVDCQDYDVEEPVVVNREGTPDSWVDDDRPAPPEGAEPADVDLELVAIRFVDNGNAEKNIGPRYRVIIRNNGKQPVDHPFNVAAVVEPSEASQDPTPRAGKRLEGIDAGQTMAVDIRLPIEANEIVKDDEGHSLARFSKLGVKVDTRNEVEEQDKENNEMALNRDDILMVDPVVFAADARQATLGQEIDLAGEGLGPEAGQVLVKIGGLELQAQIEGWYDLGVRVKLPSLPLAGEAKAELVVVRGDGAASNPMALAIAATQSAPPPPAEE